MTDAFVTAAAWWTADAGPPHPELLPRTTRATAGFVTRVLAHVLGRLGELAQLRELPWVLGTPGPDAHALRSSSALRRAVDPCHGLSVIEAGQATVAMAVVEALGFLEQHPVVLVAFVQDATPPYSEAMAAALVLAREATPDARLRLVAPQLRRTLSHSRPPDHRLPSIEAAIRLARAVDVGRPTVETIPSGGPQGGECWAIELQSAL